MLIARVASTGNIIYCIMPHRERPRALSLAPSSYLLAGYVSTTFQAHPIFNTSNQLSFPLPLYHPTQTRCQWAHSATQFRAQRWMHTLIDLSCRHLLKKNLICTVLLLLPTASSRQLLCERTLMWLRRGAVDHQSKQIWRKSIFPILRWVFFRPFTFHFSLMKSWST